MNEKKTWKRDRETCQIKMPEAYHVITTYGLVKKKLPKNMSKKVAFMDFTKRTLHAM